jgi:2-dehydro-3-deoxyphosphooctonate aldolase (KDO 8-P synthase)
MPIAIDARTTFGDGRLGVIAGPCVAEDLALCLEVARELKRVASKLDLPLVFKSSYAKENRSSIGSYRGPGIEAGLDILAAVRAESALPVISDIHDPEEAAIASRVLDVLQVPAFLCRQTPLLLACAATGKPVNVKKGQFVAPEDMIGAVEKLRTAGCPGILLTERGATFGYHDLVVDMRSFTRMGFEGVVTVYDVTHSLQTPGGPVTGGAREYALPLARAAVAAGAQAVFLETHPDPARARSDAATQLPLASVEGLLGELKRVHAAVARVPASTTSTTSTTAHAR